MISMNMELFRKKTRFVARMNKRFFLRFHMSLILFGTVLAGLLASKVLLTLNLTNMILRYPLAVIISYAAFFGFIKLWLAYITTGALSRSDNSLDPLDVLDATTSITDFSGVRFPSGGGFHGGGGAGGGAGASGSFDVAVSSGPDSGDLGSAAADAASGVDDEGGCVLVVLGILLAIVFGAGIYLVYEAPFVLTEAAFDFILAAGLLKSARKMDRADWVGSIFRTTWKPFAAALSAALMAAAFMHAWYPEAVKLSEILRR